MSQDLNNQVKGYWEQEPCGTSPTITGQLPKESLEWFKQIEEFRYRQEPFIHSIAQFTRHRGKKILEIGVGAGSDHLQWARAGLDCYGVDLTEAAIATARKHLAFYGFSSNLQCVDAERLPFSDESFDVVYSWGVIHHSKNPAAIIQEIRRILKKNGVFIGMLYHRHSLVALKLWIAEALLAGRPFRSLNDVVWHHMESVGTKSYTIKELSKLFAGFSEFSAAPVMTPYDMARFPPWLSQFFPQQWGWFITLKVKK